MIRYGFYILFVFITGFFIGAGLVRYEIVPAMPMSILYDNMPFLHKHITDIPIVNEKIIITPNEAQIMTSRKENKNEK